jgi:LPS export ABC transporter protein LptC
MISLTDYFHQQCKKPAILLSGLALFLIFFSCKNDIETINALTNDIEFPDQTAFDVEIAYTDSGLLKGKIYAPEVNVYARKEEPYIEFPQGIRVIFYTLSGIANASVQAKYAIYFQKEKLWEARYQVVAENPGEGKKLETEQLFWDEKTEQIYSDKYSKITNPNGVSMGENGFEAKQDLTWYKLKRTTSTINLKEDLTEEEPVK